ncbi:MAG: GtrA family protein, partial [Clostridiales bacterium]
ALEYCTVLHHARNLGKGQALKTAFLCYMQNYSHCFQGVIMADADGQHMPEDICRIAALLDDTQEEILLGCRDFNLPTVPRRSRIGNRLTSTVFRILYGSQLNDTQTGLRGLSNQQLSWICKLPGSRFEFEINMLIESRKRGVTFHQIPISTVYFDNNANSNYHTIRDSWPIMLALLSGLFEYLLSAAASGVIDLGLFLLLNALLPTWLQTGLRLAIALCSARIASSLLNYTLNRKLVFGANRRKRSSVGRYYILWGCQLSLAWVFVYLGEMTIPIHVGWIKIMVDLLLALLSYQIQLHWVFAHPEATEKQAVS